MHAGDVDGVALCRMFNSTISTRGVPKYLSSNNDPLFPYHQWQANLGILSVDEIKTVPYTPLSHPFIERVIGTIHREFLDHTLFWNAVDLERKLVDFHTYHNHHLTRSSLGGETPVIKDDLVFCHQYPTGTCVGGNPGVRSSRDNVASAPYGPAADREGMLRLPASRRSGARVGGYG